MEGLLADVRELKTTIKKQELRIRQLEHQLAERKNEEKAGEKGGDTSDKDNEETSEETPETAEQETGANGDSGSEDEGN